MALWKADPERVWRNILEGNIPGLRILRACYKILPGRKRCKNCYVPLSGAVSVLFRLTGRKPYSRNPQFCNWCMWLGKVYPGGAETELSLIFIDIRGSTQLAESLRLADYSALINKFYGIATKELVRTDAFIDKFVGDQVIGFYFPGYAGRRHARKALVAALRLGRSMGYGSEDGPWLPIGVGVHTGTAYVGTVSGSEGTITDFTALGDDVNIAARLVEQARAGQVCVSDAAYQRAGLDFPDAMAATITVKGKSEPVHVHFLRFAKGV